jgi:hypothetical protein
MLAYNQRLFEQFESVRIEVQEVLSQDDRVLVTSRQHAVPKTGAEEMVVQVILRQPRGFEGLRPRREGFPLGEQTLTDRPYL